VYSLQLYSINTIVYALKNTIGVFFTGPMPWDLPSGALEQAYDRRMPRYGFYFSGAIVEIGPRCRMGETVPYPSSTMILGPVNECPSFTALNRRLVFNYAPANPDPRIQTTTLYYALAAPVAAPVFDEASASATWGAFTAGEGKCAALMQSTSRDGLRASGWQAISVNPVDLVRRLIDYQIATKLPPKFAKESDVVLAAITEGRRAVVVKISGVWDTRYVLLVPPRTGS
jgi:hypothetical protein